MLNDAPRLLDKYHGIGQKDRRFKNNVTEDFTENYLPGIRPNA